MAQREAKTRLRSLKKEACDGLPKRSLRFDREGQHAAYRIGRQYYGRCLFAAGGYVPVLIGQRYRMEIVNAGVPGNTSAQGLRRIKEDVLARHPDVYTVLFGMNDHVAIGPNRPAVPVDEFRSNLVRIVRALKLKR